MQAPPPPAPAVLPPEPSYLPLLVQVPQAPVVRMDELNEQPARRASDVYPTTMSTSIQSEKERRNFIKLVQARFSQITPEDHDMIAGQGTVEQRDTCLKQQKKWAQNFQRNWIGASSWIQKFIADAICWHDYQVQINNMHRHVKLLSIAIDREPEVARNARRARGREYKKALAVHQEHIRRSIAVKIQEAQTKIDSIGRGRTAMAGEAQLRDLQRELANLRV
ncbi:hypothetical protein FB567DRAFT_589383 [Paraphoma chrysanthemicola]|uniref:Uncharacterized protein n=1 Tax=Paraphoma chrysanthemicola TaxID=798071 RepID=A0A8K0RC67_9PLEO|nr:hypothetical protein FB567DRAFT_589383 [Paraphoma chrysanthemicola]